jgi:single-strand DNA-binding protein
MRNAITTFEGNLTGDIDLKYAANGNAYARASVAVNRSRKRGDTWEDETDFIDISILDARMAENAAESLTKGTRVLVTGHLETRTVENDEGSKRTFWGCIVDCIGPSLRWSTASVFKDNKSKSGGGAPSPGGDFFDAPSEEPF